MGPLPGPGARVVLVVDDVVEDVELVELLLVELVELVDEVDVLLVDDVVVLALSFHVTTKLDTY
jgi:hypothetical protein